MFRNIILRIKTKSKMLVVARRNINNYCSFIWHVSCVLSTEKVFKNNHNLPCKNNSHNSHFFIAAYQKA